MVSLLVGRKLPLGWNYLVVPEPPGLGEALRQEKPPVLSEEELRTLKDDGVLLMRGLVKRNDTLERLWARMWPHVGIPFKPTFYNHRSWLYNGGVRALLRDGPLGDVLAQAVGRDQFIFLHEAPIWGFDPVKRSRRQNWHTDARNGSRPLISIWIVLGDVPVPLRFMRGSHLRRDEIEAACAKLKPGGKAGFKMYDRKCVDDFAPILEKELGLKGPAVLETDLKAGDAFLFNGNVLHEGMHQVVPRLSVSLRGEMNPRRPPEIGDAPQYKFPQIYPQDSLSKEDFECGPWAVLPGVLDVTPWIPAGGLGRSVLRLFDRF